VSRFPRARDAATGEILRRTHRHRWRRAGNIGTSAAAGLLGSLLVGAFIAEFAVGQINPVVRATDRPATLFANRESFDAGVRPTIYQDVPRSTWGGPIYGTIERRHRPWSEAAEGDWLDDVKQLEARWAREDRARDAALARVSADITREAEVSDAFQQIGAVPPSPVTNAPEASPDAPSHLATLDFPPPSMASQAGDAPSTMHENP